MTTSRVFPPANTALTKSGCAVTLPSRGDDHLSERFFTVLGVITDSPAALPLRDGSCSIVGQSLLAGGDWAETLNVTGTTAGEPEAPVAVTVTFPVYDP